MELILQPTADAASLLAAHLIRKQITAKPDSVLGLATGSTRLTRAEYYRWVHEQKPDWQR